MPLPFLSELTLVFVLSATIDLVFFFVVIEDAVAVTVIVDVTIAISVLDLIDDAAFTFGFGTVFCPNIGFALSAAIAEDAFDEVGSPDSHLVKPERR